MTTDCSATVSPDWVVYQMILLLFELVEQLVEQLDS